MTNHTNEGLRFGVVLTTPRLVALLGDDMIMKDNSLHIDATYKLNWQGYPILITAISDADHRTQGVALALLSHKDIGAFEFLLGTFQQAPQRFGGPNYQSNSIMADGAGAISSAVHNIFGNSCKRGMCWAHMFQNVDKQLPAVGNDLEQNKIKDALRVLQLAPTPVEFQHASQLFYEWLGENPAMHEFRQYFWAQWMGALSGWYEGYSGHRPSMNNGLEAINRTIKDSHILRDRLPLGEAIGIVKA